MIPHLQFELTTIPHPNTPPVRLALIESRVGNKIEIPWRDFRLGAAMVHMEDDAAEFLMDAADPTRDMTMRVALKGRYVSPDGRPIGFWGPVLRPEFDYDTGWITVNAVGPEFRMSKAYVVGGDAVIDPGITLDGPGFQALLAMAQNRESQDDLDWPSLGIFNGIDTTTASAERGTLVKGDEIWSQGFVGLGDAVIGPDFEIEPLETDPPSARYARLNTWDKPDTDDPEIKATFHKGFGKANAERLNVSTDGAVMVNEVIYVARNTTDLRTRQNFSSRGEYGTYQAYESSGEQDSLAVLQAKGDAKVKAYGRPLPTPDLVPAFDSGQDDLPRLLVAYKVGEFVRGVARQGHCTHDLVMQVVRGTLTQATGGVSTTLDVLPVVSLNSELSDS